MRIAIGGLWHETNTFSPARTAREDFCRFQLSEAGEVLERNRGVANEVGGFIQTGCRLGFELVPLLFAGALPSATVSQDTYQFLRGRMLDGLRRAGPLDGILVALHGAMVAEGVDDVEMDLLSGIRAVTGGECPVVATVDLHANLSREAVDLADVVVGYDTYPHVDIYDRGCEAAEILHSLLQGMRVRSAFRKLPLLSVPQAQGTSDEPMRTIIEAVHRWERTSGMVSVTVTAGYPYADVARLGMTVTAYSAAASELAEECCRQIAELIWARRQEFTIHNTPAGEAVRQAKAAPAGPVILVDVADNIGGGTPGDGTLLLRELLAQEASGAVVTLVDPASVSAAIAAGVGHEVNLKAGGKSDSFHGSPVTVHGVVRLISDGVYVHRGSYMTGLRVEMGRTAVVDANGVEVVLMERKAMPFDAEQLRCLGIEPAQRKILVVKSAIAWKAAYGDMARRVTYVDTPGLCSSNLLTFPYKRAPRPVYPLDPTTTYDDSQAARV